MILSHLGLMGESDPSKLSKTFQQNKQIKYFITQTTVIILGLSSKLNYRLPEFVTITIQLLENNEKEIII